MRNRNGSALFYLLFEKGNNRAVGAENVAETHRHEFGFAVSAERLNYHLAYSLRRAHNVRRVNRLVRGNLNKGFNSARVRAAGNVERTENVVFNRFVRACFH